MSHYAKLQAAAQYVADIDNAIQSVSLCANFLRDKLIDPDLYEGRSVEALTNQLLESTDRLAAIRAKASA